MLGDYSAVVLLAHVAMQFVAAALHLLSDLLYGTVYNIRYNTRRVVIYARTRQRLSCMHTATVRHRCMGGADKN